MTEHDDRELEALLRAADPASDLPPADPTRVARLLEDTMTDPQPHASRTDGAPHRGRATWLAAAVAALLIGGGVLFAATRGDDGPAPSAGDAPSDATTPSGDGDVNGATGATDGPPTVTELTAAGAALQTKCMVPTESPQVVAGQETVFDGVVESVSGSTVTLVPSKFYAGQATDLVVVQAPGAEMEALLSAVSFEEGERYLVAATDGRVTLCGFSARWSEALAATYAEAFPG
ncbi:hypothetical protein ABFT23_05925 [Nocardioides sp. C4-1]|uniref:hypothetical protein n=1 Tax=Nocardioides sp. C4-1 TaxID=3151851 RepID=UPI003264BAB4